METTYQINQPQVNLLDDLDINLVRASHGNRFANLIVDVLSFYVVMIPLAIFSRTFLEIISTPFAATLCLGLYFSLVELVFRGKTLGKLFTGTRAVQEDGTPITAGQAFGRGFSRMVPFEVFSALGSPSHPWHDRWTHTYVIDVKQSTLPATTA